MYYVGTISKMAEWSLLISIQYHSNPSLCPNKKCQKSWSWTVLWWPTRSSRTNTKKKRYPFHHRGQACKSRSEEIPGITGKFGPGVQSEVGQRIIRFYQENALFMENAIFQQRKGWPDMDITRCSIWKSDWLYTLQPKMKNLYKVSKNKIGSEL